MEDDNGNRIRVPNGYSMKKIIKKFPSSDEVIKKYATKVVIGQFADIDKRKLMLYLFDNAPVQTTNFSQKIKNQMELLGGIVSINPDLDRRVVVVTKLDDKFSPKFVGYCLATGATAELKIHKKKNPADKRVKKVWSDLPLHNGDIIYLNDCKKALKRRKNPVTDKWEEIPGEFEWWLEDYSIYNL